MEYVAQIHEDYVAEANIAPAIETLTRIYEKALSREIEKIIMRRMPEKQLSCAGARISR